MEKRMQPMIGILGITVAETSDGNSETHSNVNAQPKSVEESGAKSAG